MLLGLLLTLCTPVFSGSLPQAQAAVPSSVTLVGSLQSELGCSGDWQPDCATTHMTLGGDGIYRFSGSLAAGNYEFKVAINDAWDESYGAGGVQGGANIGLTVTGVGAVPVKFYYDPNSHWITSNKNAVIATAAGSFQSEIGCPGDWQPDCLKSWLQDLDGDGLYTAEFNNIPVGSYEFKVALDEAWDVSYGGDGGANVPFTIAAAGTKLKISYNGTTHAITASTGDGLAHNSQDPLYRQPFGAVNPNTPVKLRFRTLSGGATGVKVRFYDSQSQQEFLQDMTPEATKIGCYDPQYAGQKCDWWQTTYTPTALTTLYYRFIISNGAQTVYYADDDYKDGGLGKSSPGLIDNSYVITVFDPAFKPISWMQNAVIYQIFPDRFRDGSKANNPNGVTEPRYDYPGPGPAATNAQIINKAWSALPEGFCQKYSNPAQPCAEGPKGRDYFGGDLAGVIQKLDYLKALGVNTLYFNPIFEAGSDHAYDTQDYKKIDHFFGSESDWDNLTAEASTKGIRIVLDGVFNHVSSDSAYFDRYHHYTGDGACESVTSPYRNWFFFHDQAGGPCAGPNGPNTMNYDAWFGFDSLPVLNKNNQQVRNYIYAGADNVAQYWLSQNNAAGWRLDVMGDGSFPDEFWQGFRQSVKSAKADAPIIGELWKKDEILPKIHGDMADTTMNYRFRNAILGFFGKVDDKGFLDDGQSDQPPSLFARKLLSLREDYPDATYYTLMNLMDSHDTQRILWSLTPGGRNREDKEFNAANLALGKARLKLATLVQMSVPGAPTIYYGDEVALNGDDDPDDRRAFPWNDLAGRGKPSPSDPYQGAGGDHNILDHYRKLTSLRAQLPELRQGELKFLLTDDANRTMAYGMRIPGQNALSIIVVNRTETGAKTLQIPLAGYLRDGVVFKNMLGNETYTSANGQLTLTLPALGGVLLSLAPDQDIKGPLSSASGLKAVAGNGKVTLTWNRAPGVETYNIYRTLLSGGGYEFVGKLSNRAKILSFTDTTVTNGLHYYYVIRAADGKGNEGQPSPEVGATPFFPIGYAVLQYPKTITRQISIIPTDNIYGQVYVAGLTDANGPTDGILAQVGFGATGSNPASWTTWVNSTYNTKSGNNYEYKGQLLPEATGTYNYLVRFSTDGGLTWVYGDQNGVGTALPGVLTVTPAADTTPPAAPANLRVEDWSSSFIKLKWDAVADAAQYRVYRSLTAGSFDYTKPLAKLAAGTTSYTDTAVSNGKTYFYVVRAVDAALNVSASSNQVSQKAELKLVEVTFRVKVPAFTPASDLVFIPGNIDQFGPWNPGKLALTKVDALNNIWEVKVNILDGTALQYKYTRGAWERVEWWGTITSTANRSISISYGANGKQLVDNTSTAWADASIPDSQKGVQNWRDPLVASTTPANGTTGAAPASIGVTFSQAILPDGADFSASIVVKKGATAVAGTIAADGNARLVFTPTAPLTAGSYTVTVNKVKSDLGGDSVPMQSPYSFTFTVS